MNSVFVSMSAKSFMSFFLSGAILSLIGGIFALLRRVKYDILSNCS